MTVWLLFLYSDFASFFFFFVIDFFMYLTSLFRELEVRVNSWKLGFIGYYLIPCCIVLREIVHQYTEPQIFWGEIDPVRNQSKTPNLDAWGKW